MLKKILCILCALFLLTGAAFAQSPYWTDDPSASSACTEGRLGCQLLQMIFYGRFSTLDMHDSLSLRVLSAVLPMMLTIEESDFEHFCSVFGAEYDTARQLYYIALGNCLWADILTLPVLDEDETAVRKVLLLFLDPQSEPDGPQQIASIRKILKDEDIVLIAAAASLPEDFVRYLLLTPDWQTPA